MLSKNAPTITLLATALLGCSSTEDAATSTSAYNPTEPVRIQTPLAAPAAEMTAAETPPVAAEETAAMGALGPIELELWNDPGFKRAFTQSYLAESDVEPSLDRDEVEDMEEIRDLIAADDISGAKRLTERKRGPKASAVFDFTLANLHFQNEELDEAAAAYDMAVRKFPKFRRAWKNVGLVHVRRGDFGQAATAFAKVIELGGGDALTYGLLGYAHSSIENNVSAESAYRMAVLLDPQTMDWQMGLARAMFKQERYADAASMCDQMITANPERTDLLLLQANAYIGLDRALDAAQNYELVDALGGSTTESLFMLGDIYVNESLFDVAVTTYLRALATDPKCSLDRPLRAARAMARHGAVDETLELVQYIEQERPDATDAVRTDLLKLRAQIAMATHATDEQVRILEELVEINPMDGQALILLGQHARQEGDLEQAAIYYERAQQIENSEAEACLRLAQLYVPQGRYREAAQLLRRAQTIEPRDNVAEFLRQVEDAM